MNYNKMDGDSLLFLAALVTFGLSMLFVGWQARGMLEDHRTKDRVWP